MKKRIFIPHSIGFILLNIFFWGLTALSLLIFILPFCGIPIDPKQKLPFEIENILLIFTIIFLLYSSIRFLLGFKINLRKNFIYTFGDMLPKFERIQYKCFVNYSDIKSIAIIASEKNSKNQRIKSKWVSSSMPKKYLEFSLVNGKNSRMCINYYTKRQIVKMLNYINHNMNECGNSTIFNIDEIMKDWYSYGGYNREDLKIKRGEKIRKKTKTSTQNNSINKDIEKTRTK